MDLETYRKLRQSLSKPQHRSHCLKCRLPAIGCYCDALKPFDPIIKFVILIHPTEAKRHIATGRMSHLSLKNSELVVGQDFSKNARVNELIHLETHRPMILYPGAESLNLSRISPYERSTFQQINRPLMIFVIDGTWSTARKMMRLSQNLTTLPKICFTPTQHSRFRVRKQPSSECYSTIEAIHHTIELLQPEFAENRKHDHLLSLFDSMVTRQLRYVPETHAFPRVANDRRKFNGSK
jgi:DTW domain-containing protein YfiP